MSKAKYSPEFKRQAVNLMESGEKPITALCKELGVKRSMLYWWKEQYKNRGMDAFKEKVGRPYKASMSEIKKL